MKDTVQWHINRSREIIREEGWLTFTKKVLTYLNNLRHRPIRLYLDKFRNRTLARFLDRDYINGFHKLYFYSDIFKNTYWLGIPIFKCPLDLWICQEIIWETKPDVIIETGTAQGGSALFLASILDLVEKGEVITIDITDFGSIPHPRITKIIGDSTSSKVVKQVEEIVGNKTAMVSLDSDHTKKHVLKEMGLYSKFVSVGNYLVVEDTNLHGHPILPSFEEGPMEAIEEFLRHRDDFEVDRTRGKFLLTFHPKGFLRRVKSIDQAKTVK